MCSNFRKHIICIDRQSRQTIDSVNSELIILLPLYGKFQYYLIMAIMGGGPGRG